MKKKRSITAPFDRLAAQIRGEVHTDLLQRYMLATDASIFQRIPAAVVYPKNSADVQAVVRFAAAHGYSLHARGAGSGLCGAAIGNGIVIDFTKHMNRLLHLDEQQGWFECQAGYRLGQLEVALKEKRFFFPPDPSSGEFATFGGMCATNASGAHSVKYGNVADYLLDAEVVLADGTLWRLSELEATPVAKLPPSLHQLTRLYQDNAAVIESAYPPIACNVAGYNLRGLADNGRLRLHRLLAGAEGTLALVTRLKFRLAPRPAADSLVVAYCNDIVQAVQAVQQTLPLGPSGIEAMDRSLLQIARNADAVLKERIPANAHHVLLLEFDGPSRRTCARLAAEARDGLLAAGLVQQAHLATTAAEKEKFWAVRKAAVPILYKLKGRKKIVALVEDAAVPVARLVPFFEGLYAIFKRHGVEFVLYGHIAKGLVHTRPLLDLKDPRDIALLRPLADEVFALVHGLEGTVSGEHGDGRLRSAYVQHKYPAIYGLLVQTKQLLDPRQIFNPEIKIQNDPNQMRQYLRFGTDYHTRELPLHHLRWNGDFTAEVEKCHGCSKCTTLTTATRMCPIYKFTRDEAAAPKAKANVLRALISGAVDQQTLYAASLQKVMSLCVNCGSCFAECPSNVNIPKLTMEAKAHYVRRFGVDRNQWLTAHVELAARTLHKFSPLMGAAARHPRLKKLSARWTGLAAQREMVLFARQSLFERLPRHLPGYKPRVLFYAGCYAGFIRPELGQTAVQVLRHLGMQVHLPPQHCCGLPLLSKGLTQAARGKVQKNIARWRSLLPRVDVIAVTCSSCGYALMQDWAYLIPERIAVQIKAKTVHICQLLNRYHDRLALGLLPVQLAYHQPCHLRLQTDRDSSMTLLRAIPGITVHDLQSHCCGMAGSWGMSAANYALSKTIGTPMIERLAACDARYAVTDCPTCQMQMEHLGRRPVRHPIEIVWESLEIQQKRNNKATA